MDFTFEEAYQLFDSETPGPLYITPHSGNAFYKPRDFQDWGTHHIAYNLAQRGGGRALIANLSRERHIGIDFFRQPPPLKQALEYYPLFVKQKNRKTYMFRKRYAWAAKDETHHRLKKELYDGFWSHIQKNTSPLIFLHRQFLNPVRHPSLIDVIPFNHKGATRKAIKEVNKKYKDLFAFIFPLYKHSFYFKTHCILFKEQLEKQVKIKTFGDKKPQIYRRLERFNKKVNRYPFLEITCMRNFTGGSITSVMEKQFVHNQHPIIHIELSEFLTERLAGIGIELIEALLKTIIKETST